MLGNSTEQMNIDVLLNISSKCVATFSGVMRLWIKKLLAKAMHNVHVNANNALK